LQDEHPVVERRDTIVPSSRANISLCTALILVVAVPTMTVEEDWHGHPMIDQPTHVWLLAAGIVVVAFFIGGALAGYRRPSAAAAQGAIVGVLAVGVLLFGASIRRLLVVHDGLPRAVVGLWCLGAIVSLVCTILGAEVGRWLTRH